jgi:hypothetical protein
LHKKIIHALEQQEPCWIGWCLFLANLYDVSSRGNKDKELKLCINFMMNSPLTYIDDLKHQIQVAKILSSKYQSISYEEEIIEIL